MLHGIFRRVSRPLVLALLLLAFRASSVDAQTRQATLRVQENLRAEPNGVVVGVLEPGLTMRVVTERGNWVQVVLRKV